MEKITLIEDGDDMILPLPNELVKEFNLKENDAIQLELFDNKIILHLDKQLYLDF